MIAKRSDFTSGVYGLAGLSSGIGLVFGLVLLAVGLVFDWPLCWLYHTELATLVIKIS